MISLEFFAHQSTFYSFVINLSIRNRPFDNNRTNEIFRAINKIDRRLIALDDSYFPNCTWLHPRNVIQFNLSTFQILNYNNSNRNLTTFDRKCFGTMVEYSTIISTSKTNQNWWWIFKRLVNASYVFDRMTWMKYSFLKHTHNKTHDTTQWNCFECLRFDKTVWLLFI